MKAVIAILVCALAAVAADRDALLKEARELERKAETALDGGRRAEAFELLARAAELRAQAKAEKPAARPQARRRPGKRLDKALKAFDEAVAAGEMEKAVKLARATRKELVAWAEELAEREVAKEPNRLARRVEKLENQVRELRELVASLR